MRERPTSFDELDEPVSLPVARVRHPATGRRTGAGDRWRMLNDFARRHQRNLPAQAARAWFYLFSNTRRGKATESHEQVAEALGVSVDTAQRALADLTAHGYLRQTKRGNRQLGPSTYLVLCPPTPHPCGIDTKDSTPHPCHVEGNSQHRTHAPPQHRTGAALPRMGQEGDALPAGAVAVAVDVDECSERKAVA